MRKSFALGLALTSLALPLAGCGANEDQPSDASLKQKATYSVYVKTPEQEDAKLDICYFAAHPDIGYVSLSNACALYKKLRAAYFNDPDWDYRLSTVSQEAGAVIQRATNPANGAYMEWDAGNDAVTFSSLNDFIVENGNIPGTPVSSYGTIPDQTSTSIDLIAWGSDSTYYASYKQKESPDRKTFDLKPYGIAIESYQGEAYLPFATYSDLFLGYLYTPLSLCQNGIYGVTETKAMAEAIKGQGLTVTEDLLKFNYQEICFNFDQFYGFAEERAGRDFASYFQHNGLEELFLKSARGADEALNQVICTLMNDGHTNFLAASPSNTEDFHPLKGEKTSEMLALQKEIRQLRKAAYPNGIPGYEEFGSTAIITFDSFDEEPSGLYAKGVPATLEEAEKNAISLFAYAYAQITRENSPIQNVLVDDSGNGGGDAKCAAYIGAMLCGGSTKMYTQDTVTGTETSACVVADANLDGKYDASDAFLSSRNIYVLTSTFAFSCANFLPAMIKQYAKGYVVGQRSGGGSNVVLMGSTAIGTAYRMSGTTQLCRWRNGTFIHIDDGVEVDMPILPERMYANGRKDLLSDLHLA